MHACTHAHTRDEPLMRVENKQTEAVQVVGLCRGKQAGPSEPRPAPAHERQRRSRAPPACPAALRPRARRRTPCCCWALPPPRPRGCAPPRTAAAAMERAGATQFSRLQPVNKTPHTHLEHILHHLLPLLAARLPLAENRVDRVAGGRHGTVHRAHVARAPGLWRRRRWQGGV